MGNLSPQILGLDHTVRGMDQRCNVSLVCLLYQRDLFERYSGVALDV